MLVLSRRVGESIIIGNDIRVTVLKIKNNQVKLGIDAPMDLAIHRNEHELAAPPPAPSSVALPPTHEQAEE